MDKKTRRPIVILPIDTDPDYSPEAKKRDARIDARRELSSGVSRQERIERSEKLKEKFVTSKEGPLYGKERSKVPAQQVRSYGSSMVMVRNGEITPYCEN